MSHRPLALVCGLTVGDYLLWNWSLSHGHDVLALISGLTLPPLTIAFLWLLALSVGRLLARTTRRVPARSARTRRAGESAQRSMNPTGTATGQQQHTPATSGASSRKLAA